MEIVLDWRQIEPQMDLNKIRQRAEQILQSLGCDEGSVLSIVVVDSPFMAELNIKYRGKQGPTNVLSFAQQEAGISAGNPNLLGDVVICWDRVLSDADSLGYTIEEMFTYLLIHGILHIVGFDHDSWEHMAEMQSRVETIFQNLFPVSV
ncbi:MAG: rRNA maturation RNase YbeY [Pseudomonadota bacterium]